MTSTWDTPAVVVGLRSVGLGVVRSLALGGCRRIVGVESDHRELPTRSRLCDVRFVSDLYEYDALRDELIAVARGMPGPKPVLFVTTDEHVAWASGGGLEGEALREHYSVLLPEEGVCRELMSKERFARLAEDRGYPVPRGVWAAGDEVVGAVAGRGLRYPLIVKPSLKTKAWARRFDDKVCVVRSGAELAAVAAALRGVPGTVVVQEFVAGEDARVCFCLCVASEELPGVVTFAGRKLYQWPRGQGNSAVCEPIDAPELEAFARRFVGETGLRGLCSIEVKYGPDGRFQIIEPTVGRPDLQGYLATLNGVNLPMIAYLLASGEVGAARAAAAEGGRRPRRGRERVWVYERAVYHLLRKREVRVRSLAPLLLRRKGYVYLSARDVGVAAGMVSRVASVAWAALGQRVRPWGRK